VIDFFTSFVIKVDAIKGLGEALCFDCFFVQYFICCRYYIGKKMFILRT